MQDHYVRSLLSDHEEVIISTRQHWFVLFQSILLELFLSAIIIAAVFLVFSLWGPLSSFGLLLLLSFLQIPLGYLLLLPSYQY